MKWLYAALICLFATSAIATVDAWPALYDVSGVAADDTLNVREAPNANARIVSTLPPNDSDIEVIRLNDAGTWGLINTGEVGGWVSMRYMSRHPNQFAGEFPAITSCHGTEPFWSLDLEGEKLTFSSLDGTDRVEPYRRYGSANRIDRFAINARGVTGMILQQSCNDGMSDRMYGLSIELLAPLYGETKLMSGCCTIQP